MAKYTINHTCGHSVEIQLFGKMDDRYRRIEWLETQECDECRRAKANAAAAAAKETRGLTDLKGSEKQVAWANTIREQAYKALDWLAPFSTIEGLKVLMEGWSNMDDQMKEKCLASAEIVKPLFDGWKNKMDAQTEAKWWIDHRYSMPESRTDTKSPDYRVAFAARNSIIGDFKNLFDEWE
jgi:hypothetical protein